MLKEVTQYQTQTSSRAVNGECSEDINTNEGIPSKAIWDPSLSISSTSSVASISSMSSITDDVTFEDVYADIDGIDNDSDDAVAATVAEMAAFKAAIESLPSAYVTPTEHEFRQKVYEEPRHAGNHDRDRDQDLEHYDDDDDDDRLGAMLMNSITHAHSGSTNSSTHNDHRKIPHRTNHHRHHRHHHNPSHHKALPDERQRFVDSVSHLSDKQLRIQLWDSFRLARVILGKPVKDKRKLSGKSILKAIQKVAEMKIQILHMSEEVDAYRQLKHDRKIEDQKKKKKRRPKPKHLPQSNLNVELPLDSNAQSTEKEHVENQEDSEQESELETDVPSQPEELAEERLEQEEIETEPEIQKSREETEIQQPQQPEEEDSSSSSSPEFPPPSSETIEAVSSAKDVPSDSDSPEVSDSDSPDAEDIDAEAELRQQADLALSQLQELEEQKEQQKQQQQSLTTRARNATDAPAMFYLTSSSEEEEVTYHSSLHDESAEDILHAFRDSAMNLLPQSPQHEQSSIAANANGNSVALESHAEEIQRVLQLVVALQQKQGDAPEITTTGSDASAPSSASPVHEEVISLLTRLSQAPPLASASASASTTAKMASPSHSSEPETETEAHAQAQSQSQAQPSLLVPNQNQNNHAEEDVDEELADCRAKLSAAREREANAIEAGKHLALQETMIRRDIAIAKKDATPKRGTLQLERLHGYKAELTALLEVEEERAQQMEDLDSELDRLATVCVKVEDTEIDFRKKHERHRSTLSEFQAITQRHTNQFKELLGSIDRGIRAQSAILFGETWRNKESDKGSEEWSPNGRNGVLTDADSETKISRMEYLVTKQNVELLRLRTKAKKVLARQSSKGSLTGGKRGGSRKSLFRRGSNS